jgi:hypothetical protein
LPEHLKTVIVAIRANHIMGCEGVPETERELLDTFNVKILSKEKIIHVDLAPKSREGHDYAFSIDRKTGKIIETSIVIGELIPDPEETL